MTVQIKLLKGFKNPINDEMNTLSLLVKSDLNLKEHLSKAKEKLLTALTCIMEDYNQNYIIYFYHKLQVIYENKTEYLSTKAYLTNSCNLKRDLNSSVEEVLKMTYGKKTSHFVNLRIKLNDDVIELSKDELSNLNWKIRSNISKMNNEEILFVNDNVKHIKKNEKETSVKPIKKAIDDSLFIDDDNVKPIKKNEKNNKKVHIVEPIDDSLFID